MKKNSVAGELLKHPYFFCFYSVINEVALFLESQGGGITASMVFDEQGELGLRTAQYYDLVSHLNPAIKHHVPNPPTFANDEQVAPLQAADMLAWHLRRRSDNPHEHLPLFDDLTRFHRGYELPQKSIAEIFSKISQVEGIEKLSSKSEWKKVKKEMQEEATSGSWRRHLPPKED